tara:strand:+ start:257 stop:1648 length:1392 start_codon:yes stop_codon:yes gene_type:complete
MKKTKKYKKLRREGEFEFKKIIGYIIIILVFVAVFFFFNTSAGAITKWFKGFQTTIIESAEGIKPLLDNFGIVDADGKQRILLAILVDKGECTSTQPKKFKDTISLYKTSLKELNSDKKITGKKDLKETFRKRLDECYVLNGNVEQFLKIDPTTSSGKRALANKILKTISNNLGRDNDAAIKRVEELIEGISDTSDIKQRLEKAKTKNNLLNEKNNKKILKRLLDEYNSIKTTEDVEGLKKLIEKNPKIVRSLSSLKDLKKNVEFKGDLLNLEKKECKGLVAKYEGKTKVFFLDSKGNPDTNKPLSLVAIKEEADCHLSKKNEDRYYSLISQLVKKSSKSLSTQETEEIKGRFNKICFSKDVKKTYYSVCNNQKVSTSSIKGLSRCYWVNDKNDGFFNNHINDLGTCRSCIDIQPASCEAYGKIKVNSQGWDPANGFEWKRQCNDDPCGFSNNGCVVEENSCK